MFRLASRLGVLVGELENRISRSEFVEWQAYENIELERYEKLDYYLAQISMYSLMPHLKKGVSLNIKDFLIKFGKGSKKKLDPKSLRNLVCSWFGVNPEAKKAEK
jgi:hypothetical protein